MPHQCPPQPPCRGRCPCNAPAPPRGWGGRCSSFTRHEKCVLAVIWATGLLLTGELHYHCATRLGHWEEALHSNWLAKGDHPVSSIQHTPRSCLWELYLPLHWRYIGVWLSHRWYTIKVYTQNNADCQLNSTLICGIVTIELKTKYLFVNVDQ